MTGGRLDLGRVTTVEALAAALRTRILDGELAPGRRLVERELVEAYGVARHSLRAALRALAAEGLVRIEPHRGAHVAALGREEVVGLYELRVALEVEAARLALGRHGGRLPAEVHAAVDELRAACSRSAPPWSDVVEAHGAVHRAIVDAAESPRIAQAHAALDAEMRLFVLALRPVWSLERMADHHAELLAALEQDGPDALRGHLADGAAAVLAGLAR